MSRAGINRRDALPRVLDVQKHVAPMKVRWLGRVNYADGLTLQEEIVAAKSTDKAALDELLLLEHEPVYTMGRTPDQSSLRDATHLPHPLFQINRGGQATYHGPGQLVGYPLIDLHHYVRDLHLYLRWIEEVLIELVALYGITGIRRQGLTGVWVEQRKIASIGVGVRRWITMHGFALNVCGDLSPFDAITPCGISDVTMTSIEHETGTPRSVIDVAGEAERIITARLEDLRAGSRETALT